MKSNIPIFNVIELSEGVIIAVNSFADLDGARNRFTEIVKEFVSIENDSAYISQCVDDCYYSDDSGYEVCLEQSRRDINVNLT